jgi:hypothetical protein
MHMTGAGAQRGWQHLKRNPWGETPTLELEDGSTLSEATAIARYIDNSHPGRKIMGETPLEQALDQQWDNRVWVHLLYRLTVAFHVLVCRLHISSFLPFLLVQCLNLRSTKASVLSSSSLTTLSGVSTAAKKPSPLRPCSTSICPMADPGCSAGQSQRSAIRLCVSQSRWEVQENAHRLDAPVRVHR